MNKDTFGKYAVRMTVNDIMRISHLLNDHVDFAELTIGDVMELNMLIGQLEEILNYERELIKKELDNVQRAR
jgi:hypothetical protein